MVSVGLVVDADGLRWGEKFRQGQGYCKRSIMGP